MNGWEAVIRKKGFESSPGGMGFRHGIEAKDPRVGIRAEFFVESLLPLQRCQRPQPWRESFVA